MRNISYKFPFSISSFLPCKSVLASKNCCIHFNKLKKNIASHTQGSTEMHHEMCLWNISILEMPQNWYETCQKHFENIKKIETCFFFLFFKLIKYWFYVSPPFKILNPNSNFLHMKVFSFFSMLKTYLLSISKFSDCRRIFEKSLSSILIYTNYLIVNL